MRYILTDIEGTTTSVAFVYETLFPYFKKHISAFLNESDLENSTLAPLLQDVKDTVQKEEGLLLANEELAQQLIAWTKADRKHPALKVLQGILWRTAYERGEIKGHIYPDVPPALERWREAGIGMGVYSSGSVEAQKLLFGHSEFGDLTPFFSNYFDTNVGHKREAASYQTIADQLEIATAEILFLSDIEAELDAALAVGIQTIQLIRPDTIIGLRHKIATDFSEILF